MNSYSVERKDSLSYTPDQQPYVQEKNPLRASTTSPMLDHR